MVAPGRPHVRIYNGSVFIERVPNYWVAVCLVEDFETLTDHEREYMISKALKKGHDVELPSKS